MKVRCIFNAHDNVMVAVPNGTPA